MRDECGGNPHGAKQVGLDLPGQQFFVGQVAGKKAHLLLDSRVVHHRVDGGHLLDGFARHVRDGTGTARPSGRKAFRGLRRRFP